MDFEAGSSARVLHLLRQAQVVDELLEGARSVRAEVTQRIATFVRSELERLHGRETSITTWESLLCDTVLQAPLTNGHPSVAGCQLSPQAWPPEKEQAPLPMALKRLVFGVEALHETFVRVMCSQTYEKAGIALRACVYVLEDAVRPQNCFQILSIAASVGNQRLLTRSAAVALLCFRQAVMQDPAGLRMLPKEVLGSLLSHDCIQAGEEDVFSALGTWVMAEEGDRLQHLYPLAAQCLRMRNMSMGELIHMDEHPLIPKCPRTLKLVAFGYLASCYGCSIPKDHACIVGRTQRQRIAVNPAVLSLLCEDEADVAGHQCPLEQHNDLFRLSPALQGMHQEAAPAAYATLHQLQEGLSRSSDGPGPAASSAEALTYGVCRLLSTQRKPHCDGSSSSHDDREHSGPYPTMNPTADPLCKDRLVSPREHFRDLDRARWNSAVAFEPPRHQPGCPSSHLSKESASSMLAEFSPDSMGHGASADTADESASCSEAPFAAASDCASGGAWARARPADLDVFNTSPSQTRKHAHMDRRQAEAQSAACRQFLENKKPPASDGLHRRLF